METGRVFRTDREDTGCALILVGEDSSQNEIVVVPGAGLSITEQEVDSLKEVIPVSYTHLIFWKLGEKNSEVRWKADRPMKLEGRYRFV